MCIDFHPKLLRRKDKKERGSEPVILSILSKALESTEWSVCSNFATLLVRHSRYTCFDVGWIPGGLSTYPFSKGSGVMFSILHRGDHVLPTFMRGDVAPTVSMHVALLLVICFITQLHERVGDNRGSSVMLFYRQYALQKYCSSTQVDRIEIYSPHQFTSNPVIVLISRFTWCSSFPGFKAMTAKSRILSFSRRKWFLSFVSTWSRLDWYACKDLDFRK